MGDKATIKIPKQLYNSLKDQIKDTGFSSVTEFIVYILRDIAGSGPIDQNIKLTKKELNQVKKRLQELGYL
jgi:Arc/MetJ-type ribon-helix-helix transcriptional regulator